MTVCIFKLRYLDFLTVLHYNISSGMSRSSPDISFILLISFGRWDGGLKALRSLVSGSMSASSFAE